MGTASLAILLLVALGGCATQTVENRKAEKPAVYQALSPEFREAVDQGKVKAGMSMDAVYLAWGKPSQVTQTGTWDKEEVAWIYSKMYTEATHYVGYRGRMFTGYTSGNYIKAEVVFRNGLVETWETLADPAR